MSEPQRIPRLARTNSERVLSRFLSPIHPAPMPEKNATDTIASTRTHQISDIYLFPCHKGPRCYPAHLKKLSPTKHPRSCVLDMTLPYLYLLPYLPSRGRPIRPPRSRAHRDNVQDGCCSLVSHRSSLVRTSEKGCKKVNDQALT